MEYELHPMTPTNLVQQEPKLTDEYILECFERKLKFQRNLALSSESLIARETRVLAKIISYCEDLECDIARLKAKIAAVKEAQK